MKWTDLLHLEQPQSSNHINNTDYFWKKIEELLQMQDIIDWMQIKNSFLINDYKCEDWVHSDHCWLIATEVAIMLINKFKLPEIYILSEDEIWKWFICTKTLFPLPFNGRVTWWAHQVCVCDWFAFDPIFPYPIPMSEYYDLLFGRRIRIKRVLDTEWIVSLEK